jgi:signal transduction histidine kinase
VECWGVALDGVNDPLGSAAHVAFAEELSSSMRHATRNKLAIIRNAATYIRRRVGSTEAWNADPRIDMFYRMLESELEDANDLLEPRELLAHVFVRDVRSVDAAACVRTAIESAHIPAGLDVRRSTEAGTVTVDARELALAVRCLVQNAGETGTSIAVSSRADGSAYVIEVSDGGPRVALSVIEQMTQPFFTTKPGHVGLGLNIAKRIAYRYGGELKLQPSEPRGLVASLRVPLAPAEGP